MTTAALTRLLLQQSFISVERTVEFCHFVPEIVGQKIKAAFLAPLTELSLGPHDLANPNKTKTKTNIYQFKLSRRGERVKARTDPRDLQLMIRVYEDLNLGFFFQIFGFFLYRIWDFLGLRDFFGDFGTFFLALWDYFGDFLSFFCIGF